MATCTRYSTQNGLALPPAQSRSAVSRQTSSMSTAGTTQPGTRRLVQPCKRRLLSPVTAMMVAIPEIGSRTLRNSTATAVAAN